MQDFWSFLLQTLTASGAAVLVLVAKALFRDKLSPRWQFCAWGLVALALTLPAGISGRYALVNWPLLVETMKSLFTGEYGTLTKVVAPVPLPVFRSGGIFDWVYIVYVAGVVFFLVRYAILYLRLRLTLGKVKKETAWQISNCHTTENLEQGKLEAQNFVDAVAEKYCLSSCLVLQAEGLTSAFVCGIFRPILVLPAGVKMDEKIILHELLHLKYHDILWGLVICLFRCLHWCNPLMWICANLAGNDLESLCDQRVLERLCGEERRDYGRILLDMAGGKYAKMPGTSSVANGGKNIRRRIVAITRFKKYPAGMGFVSICILLTFSVPFFAGTKPAIAFGKESLLFDNSAIEMARARIIRCTTYAGAFDTYAKAVLTGNILYRAMCAPLDEQNLLAKAYQENWKMGNLEKLALPGQTDIEGGYQIYNLEQKEENMWEGLLVLKLLETSDETDLDETDSDETKMMWFAVQNVCAEKQGDRFVVVPKDEFTAVQSDECTFVHIHLSEENEFPAWCYEADAKDFMLRMRWQTMASVESQDLKQEGGRWSSFFDPTPKPDGVFSIYHGYELSAIYTGKPEDKSRYTQVGYTGYMVWDGKKESAAGNHYQSSASKSGSNNGEFEQDRSYKEFESGEFLGEFSSTSSDGSSKGSRPLEEGWNDEIFLSGGGGNGEIPGFYPDCYIVDFYLNNQLEERLVLEMVEGDGDYER